MLIDSGLLKENYVLKLDTPTVPLSQRLPVYEES